MAGYSYGYKASFGSGNTFSNDLADADSASVFGDANTVSGATNGAFICGTGNIIQANGAQGITTIGKNNTVDRYTAIAIGSGNTASGNRSTAIGRSNVNEGTSTFSIGNDNEMSSNGGILIGSDNTATGGVPIVLGSGNTSTSTTNQFGLLHGCTMSNPSYITQLGAWTIARWYGGLHLGMQVSNGAGTDQVMWGGCRGTTTDNTETEIFLAGITNERMDVLTDSTIGFKYTITARRTDVDGGSAYWQGHGLIRNDGGTEAIVGSVTKTKVASEGITTADIAFTAANDALTLKVTGEAAKTINWHAVIEANQVVG